MTRPGVTLLATTNREGAIDPAILRPGRIDKIIPVELPNEDGRKEILQSYIDKAKKKADSEFRDQLFDLDDNALADVASQAHDLSGADLENLVNRSLEEALDRELETGKWTPINSTGLLVAMPKVRIETEKKRKLGFV